MRSFLTLGALAGLLVSTTAVQSKALDAKANPTGFQAGLVVAHSMTKTKLEVKVGDQVWLPNVRTSPLGAGVGVFLSYLHALGSGPACPVAGLDASYTHSFAKDKMTVELDTNVDVTMGAGVHHNLQQVTFDMKEKGSWFVAARFGVAMGNVLPYVRLGYGQTKYEGKVNSPDNGSPFGSGAVGVAGSALNVKNVVYDVATGVARAGTTGFVPEGSATNATVSPPTGVTRGIKKAANDLAPQEFKSNVTAHGPVFGLGVDTFVTPNLVVGLSANYFLLGDKKTKGGDKMSFNKWNAMLTVAYKI